MLQKNSHLRKVPAVPRAGRNDPDGSPAAPKLRPGFPQRIPLSADAGASGAGSMQTRTRERTPGEKQSNTVVLAWRATFLD